MINDLEDYLQNQITPYLNADKWWVACSGGKDSMVLLDVLNRLSKQISCPSINVIHIHHGLQDEATAWAAQLYNYCMQSNISLHLYFLKQEKQTGIEAWARQQRYQIFNKVVGDNEILMMAHHANDQAETFLWHAIRGSGLDGLSGIPKTRVLGKGVLLRPLLSLSQQNIHAYQNMKNLPYSQDQSNFDTKYTRNKIRHDILPIIENEWPRVIKTFSTNTEILQLQKALLEKYLKPVFLNLFDVNGICLSITKLLTLDKEEQVWCLRYWLQYFGLPVLGINRLTDLMLQLNTNNQLELVINVGCSIRRYKDNLYLVGDLSVPPADFQWCWQDDMSLHGYPSLLSTELFSKNQLANLSDSLIDVRFGQTGETIKKYWQSRQVPPWVRLYLPVFYQNNHRLHEVNYSSLYRQWHYAL